MGFLVLLLFLNGGLFAEELEDLKECRMVSGKPGLCVPIRYIQCPASSLVYVLPMSDFDSIAISIGVSMSVIICINKSTPGDAAPL